MRYRVCKSFEIESGHMLMKHPGRCRLPHGHSRRVDIVLAAESLDENDMVCDFKAVKLAVASYLDDLDHALMINADDPAGDALEAAGVGGRLVRVEGADPTTEVMARRIFDRVTDRIASGETMTDANGHAYGFPPGLAVERVRVTETSSSWAEYGM